MSDKVVLGGVEGGSSHTVTHLYTPEGELLAEYEYPDGCNHWLIGYEKAWKTIRDSVTSALTSAGLPPTTTLQCLGLSLSGVEGEAVAEEYRQGISKAFPGLAHQYLACSDTLGSVYTVRSNGGLVLISGTGSNSLIVNPNMKTFQCGGWGYMLGDEGSAYILVRDAVKACINALEGFQPVLHPTDRIWKLLEDEWGVKSIPDLLPVFYKDFKKSRVAGLCVKLAHLARDGDALSRSLFERTGSSLGDMVNALIPKADRELLTGPGGLPIVCVGSVWKSWDLLKPGFIAAIQERGILTEFSLISAKCSAAAGAAYLAARHHSLPFTYQPEMMGQEIFHWKA